MLDGIKATAAMHASGKSDAKTIPIIGVSANGFADDIRKARESGPDEYDAKPIDRDSLLSAVCEVDPADRVIYRWRRIPRFTVWCVRVQRRTDPNPKITGTKEKQEAGI